MAGTKQHCAKHSMFIISFNFHIYEERSCLKNTHIEYTEDTFLQGNITCIIDSVILKSNYHEK